MKNIILFLNLLFAISLNAQTLVSNIAPGLTQSNPNCMYPFNGNIVFAADDGFNGVQLFHTDASNNNTVMLTNFSPTSSNANTFSYNVNFQGGPWAKGGGFVVIDSIGYFIGESSYGYYELFKTDGTAIGTISISSAYNIILASRIFEMDGKICTLLASGTSAYNNMLVYDPTNGSETLIPFPMGTDIIYDHRYLISSWSSNFSTPFIFNDKIYSNSSSFSLSQTYIHTIDISGNLDTVLTMSGMNNISNITGTNIILNDNFLFYSATHSPTPSIGNELYSYSFTNNQVSLIKDINPYFNYSSDIWFCQFPYFDEMNHTKVFFKATHEDFGTELWVSDGTPGGTNLVSDLTPGPNSSNLSTSINNYAMYNGDTLIHLNLEIVTNGTFVNPIINNTNHTLDGFRYRWNKNNVHYLLSGYGYFCSIQNSQFSILDSISTLSCSTFGWPNDPYAEGNILNVDCDLFFGYDDCDYTGDELFKTSNLCSLSTGLGTLVNNQLSISSFPNPTNGILSITLAEISTGVYCIRNYIGQVIFCEDFTNKKTLNANLSGSPGIYFIQFVIDGQMITKKIVKE